MIYVAIDDTDMPDTRGTGQVARRLADELMQTCEVRGVSRHQLLSDDPRVPKTRKNSAKVIHVKSTRLSLEALADVAEDVMRDEFIPGSDPGLCVVSSVTPAMLEFGRKTQRELVTREEAGRVVEGSDAIVRGLGGTCGGVIGATAAAGLAAAGSDGRFIYMGELRSLSGPVDVAEVLAVGVVAIRTVDGRPVTSGKFEFGEKVRPEIIGHQPIVLVTEEVCGFWQLHKRDRIDGQCGSGRGMGGGHGHGHGRRAAV